MYPNLINKPGPGPAACTRFRSLLCFLITMLARTKQGETVSCISTCLFPGFFRLVSVIFSVYQGVEDNKAKSLSTTGQEGALCPIA
ncbi:hypothetical protein EDD18DRAFT_1196934 [Armillaria luteobubalina]|uniref:Uncharacterized protein n=1 Tax=Armillaria luteobubalina TaxID=153913 RepID=A0AA39PHF2_9AGAR|nr:hypothetical protein EDD18DRAFT_1196934 [Armillaria luteobubalina]